MKLTCSIDQVKELTASEVKAILERDKAGEYVLLDVRQPEEYQSGHIPHARSMPIGDIETKHTELDKGNKIISYCRSGPRSKAASLLLCGLGFANLYHLEGGLKAWSYEIETSAAKQKPPAISDKDNVADILMVAMKMEKGAFTYYNSARAKVQSPRTAELFGKLALVEESHFALIYHRYTEMLGKASLPPLEQLKKELTADYMEGNIEVNRELLKLERAPFKDDLEAHEIALEIEYLSLDFYTRSAAAVGDPKAIQVLSELAEADRLHIAMITEMLSRLVKPQGLGKS